MGIFSFLKFRRKSDLERRGPARRRQQQATDKPGAKRRRAKGTSLVAGIAVLMVWGASTFSILYQPTWSQELIEGMIVPHDIFAQVDFSAEDISATEEARNLAANKVADVYHFDAASVQETRDNFDALFLYLDNFVPLPEGETRAPDDKTNNFRARFGDLSSDELKLFRFLFTGRSRRQVILQKVNVLLELGVISPDTQKTRTEKVLFTYDEKRYRTTEFSQLLTPERAGQRILKEMRDLFVELNLSPEQRKLTEPIIAKLTVPNLRYDDKLTQAEQRKARNAVPTISKNYRRDAIILKKSEGRRVTLQDLRILDAHRKKLEDSRSGADFLRNVARLCGWSLLVTIAGAFFFGTMMPKICRRRSSVLLIALVMSMGLFLVWGTVQLVINVFSRSPVFLYPLLPLVFVSALLSLLLRPPVGMAAGIISALLVSLQGGDPIHVFVLGTAASVSGALAVKSARTRLQIFRMAAYTPILIIAVEMLYLFQYASFMENWRQYLIVAGLAIGGCFVAALLVNIFLPFLEFFFTLTTDISLLELSDLNHPLLKRLSLEAPGTYTHTMMVATLAEHAAEAIGANTLMTRVAAYFHDIGKLGNPDYFTENSFDRNMHQDLSPKMSSLIILNHVKEGLALAAKFKLKPPLREAIATHHGTSLVYYFYFQAKTQNTLKAGGGEHEYRYPGPRPRSPEATIICLSDPCEAASRSIEKPTPQKIDALVDDIFNGKLKDGQLDNSELTMSELHTVRETIKKTLRVMLHSRIAYPKEEDANASQVDNTRQMMHPEKTRNLRREDILDGNVDDKDSVHTRIMDSPLDEKEEDKGKKSGSKSGIPIENTDEQKPANDDAKDETEGDDKQPPAEAPPATEDGAGDDSKSSN